MKRILIKIPICANESLLKTRGRDRDKKKREKIIVALF
jgi:hypothetical protein